ncbi:pyridine nucleotide-disulfide oxidoreductase family protein [[Clostridium] bifermentans ATCC 638]|uniref:Pyridine nucleotide-disulfide oxidoreductase family protein n=1 Tax=Paraclostridium bifermentans ATCC 638 = DSM 14991 TaxID=1233171 RepID=T4VJ51_PARBF|nr:FAD-dependent oxidoreductase [Paraclostridium bifermentans]EQK43739.1 pyridine nucleotide-disulfide oxidoreductase family protein [[Clostridium] bifermentans ATCC 638] [Paraclostridium bifermentans ATCC 638 = DSM 14991]RIZ59562.1 pyridine nucleotide-disulfide oxidoreductase [Paraclostridium bifermentans]UAG17574.1 FAD-dependent oxidoreductase [Paraclostridium bifermentans]
MSKKIVIVGGVAGGASAAARLRRLGEENQIVMFEKGPHVSFSNCCLPYHLSSMIEDSEDLVLMNPQVFYKQYRIDARVYNEVVSIDRENKKVLVKNVVTEETYEESYDKLILSPGAKAIVPNLKGIDNINLFTVRNVVDIAKLNTFIKENEAKNISVIGGGFIGIEVAENLKEAGYNVNLIEATDQIMKPFDYDMVQILHKEIHENGVNLIVGDKVVEFEKNIIVLGSGKKVEADAVVMAIGVTPETTLAIDCGLEIGETGAIKVDSNYLTSDRYIYAVGDAIEVYNALSNSITKLPLAGPAQKQARAVADHIHGIPVKNTGFIGSSCIQVFGYNGASTGLNEGQIKALGMGINYEVVRVIPQDKVGLMPGSMPLHFKLIYEVPTGKILGAQAIGKGNADKRVDIIATLIKLGGTLEDLKDLELCYAPPFGTAKDVVNMAGLVGSNLLQGIFKQVYVHQVRDLVENNEIIIDVREEDEYKDGHIKGAINIPLSQIRDRINEIPKDKNVYLHCRSAQRSYNAIMALTHMGFDNIYNISGGFMGISFYEYFNDVKENRTPIVTKYNFN